MDLILIFHLPPCTQHIASWAPPWYRLLSPSYNVSSEHKQKGFSPLLTGVMQEASFAWYTTGFFCWNGYQLEQQNPAGFVVLQIAWMLLQSPAEMADICIYTQHRIELGCFQALVAAGDNAGSSSKQEQRLRLILVQAKPDPAVLHQLSTVRDDTAELCEDQDFLHFLAVKLHPGKACLRSTFNTLSEKWYTSDIPQKWYIQIFYFPAHSCPLTSGTW